MIALDHGNRTTVFRIVAAAWSASHILVTVLEMIECGIVRAVIIEAAAVEEGDHQSDAQCIRERDTEDESHDSAYTQTGEPAEDTGSDNRQYTQQKRAANDPRQAETRRIRGRDMWAAVGRIFRSVGRLGRV
jgi:hypothetical protein